MSKFLTLLYKKYNKKEMMHLINVLKRLNNNPVNKNTIDSFVSNWIDATNYLHSASSFFDLVGNLDSSDKDAFKDEKNLMPSLRAAIFNIQPKMLDNTHLIQQKEIKSFFEKKKAESVLTNDETFLLSELQDKADGIFSLYEKDILEHKINLFDENVNISNVVNTKDFNESNALSFSCKKALDDNADKASNLLYLTMETKKEIANLEIKNTNLLDWSLHNNKLSKKAFFNMHSAIKNNVSIRNKLLDYLSTDKEIMSIESLRFKKDTSNKDIYISLDEAFAIIKDAFKSISVEMSDFVDYMVEEELIFSELSDKKRSGAYATRFPNEQKSIVFLQYNGSVDSLITLAHELGHAFHHKQLNHLPIELSRYPMTLAESASMFAESIVIRYLKNNNKELFNSIKHKEIIKAFDLLIMIPSRFEIEYNFEYLFDDNLFLSSDLSEAYKSVITKWYNITDFENESTFSWSLIRHYFLSNIAYYNYPYYFGYLFNLKLDTLVNEKDFFENYKAFLKGTCDKSVDELLTNFNIDLYDLSTWDSEIKKLERHLF